MVELRWSEHAENNLRSIYEYIAEDSKIYAYRYVKKLIKTVDKLKCFPLMGRVVPEFTDQTIHEVIYQNYRIVYRFTEITSMVEILAVVHASRDVLKTLSTEWEL